MVTIANGVFICQKAWVVLIPKLKEVFEKAVNVDYHVTDFFFYCEVHYFVC